MIENRAFTDQDLLFWQLSEVTLKRFSQGEKLRIFDCRGVDRRPEYSAAFQGNLMKTIRGHIKNGYEVKKNSGISTNQVFYFVCSIGIRIILD